MPNYVELTCQACGRSFTVVFKYRRQKCCSKSCAARGERNPAYGKTYKTKENDPEWASKISKTLIKTGHICGDSNPMRNEKTRAKASATRKQKFKDDPEFREANRQHMIKAWKDGKFDNVSVGKCKWYDFEKSDGTVIKLQGTWELAYAKYLNDAKIDFMTHKGRISYVDDSGVKRNYYPDFYLINESKYIEIKNKYHYELSDEERKFELIKEQNPELKIQLLFKSDLQELGINVK